MISRLESEFDTETSGCGRIRVRVFCGRGGIGESTVARSHCRTWGGQLSGQRVVKLTFALCALCCGVGNLLDRQPSSLERTGSACGVAEVPDSGTSAKAGERTARIPDDRSAPRVRMESRCKTVICGGAGERQGKEERRRAVMAAALEMITYERRYRLGSRRGTNLK